MKFICTKENLLGGITSVAPITGKHAHLPILNNILIHASPTQITLTGTNLEATLNAVVRGKIEQEGDFTIPARTFADYVALLPQETNVECEVVGSELVVRASRQKAKIKGSPATEFPATPHTEGGDELALPTDRLKRALQRVLLSVSHSEVRPELQGVLLFIDVQDPMRVTLASTDSYRLTEVRVDLLAPHETPVRVIIPQRAAQELCRLLSAAPQTITLSVQEGQIVCRVGDVTLTSRLIDGNYPDYRQIIPKEWRTEIKMATQETLSAIRAAALFATQGVNAVLLHANPSVETLSVTSASSQAGEQSSEIGVEGGGEENTVTLNHRFLLDGLAAVDEDRVELKIVNGESPCLMKPEKTDEYLCIIMPIRQ